MTHGPYGPEGRPLRVCFVAPHAYPVLTRDRRVPFVGGAEVQQCLLARALAARGYRVSMICHDHGQSDGVEIDGVTVYKAFRFDAGLPALRFFHPRLSGLWRAMQRADADVYYQRAAGMLTGIVAHFCRSHGRRAIYAGAHDSDFMPGSQAILLRRDRWLFEYGLRHVDAVLVQNPNQARLCRAHYGRTPRLIRNCYAPPADARRHPAGVVLWVGTLREFKRPELLVSLAQAMPDVRFRMVGGPGSDRPADIAYYRRLERSAEQAGNIEIAGFVPFAEVEAEFDKARVLISTSVQEGFPNTFLQAWARGIPTISFFDPGVPPGSRPICRLVRDLPEACQALRGLLADPSCWEAEGERARRYYQARHTPAAVLPGFERLLRAL